MLNTFKLAELLKIAEITNQQVADEAGVSKAMVSQVLAGKKTSSKVEGAARQLIVRAVSLVNK